MGVPHVIAYNRSCVADEDLSVEKFTARLYQSLIHEHGSVVAAFEEALAVGKDENLFVCCCAHAHKEGCV